MGHAIDFWMRKRLSTDYDASFDETDWEKMSDHYAIMVFEEYLACILSSRTVTETLQKDNIENWQNDADRFIQTLLRRRLSLVTNVSDIINVFWVIIVQLGKLLGNQHNKENFPKITFYNEYDDVEVIEKQRKIINSLAETLDGFIDNYPDVPEDSEIIEKLKPYFLELAGMYNFFFREEDVPKYEYDDDDDDY